MERSRSSQPGPLTGRMNRWTVGGCLVAVVGCACAWWSATAIARTHDRADREVGTRSVADIAAVTDATMRRQLDLARVGAAFVAQNADVSTADVQRWTDALRLDESYPDVVAVQVVDSGPNECRVLGGVTFRRHDSAAHDLAGLCQRTLTRGSDPRAVGGDAFVARAGTGPVQFVARAPMDTGGYPHVAGVHRAGGSGLVFVVVVDPDALIARSLEHHPGHRLSLTDTDGSLPDVTVAPDRGDAPDWEELGVTKSALPGGWTASIGAPVADTGLAADDFALVVLLIGGAVSIIAGTLVVMLGRARSRAMQTAADRSHEMHRQAHTDSLTGLSNRAAVTERIDRLLSWCQRERAVVAVLSIDLDDFKDLNDSFGDAAGDQLLVSVGERLRRGVRTADLVGRIGGDEFAVVLYGSVLDIAPEVVAHRLIRELRTPHVIKVDGVSRVVTSSVSIGIAQGRDAERDDLLRNADLALHAAKTEGKDRFNVFVPEMHDVVRQRLSLGLDLRAATDLSQFELWYQPLYQLNDLSVVGAEALLRWNHPRLGTVQPDRFIPILEHTRQIVDVGRWVLMQACVQAAQWQHVGHSMGIAVNMSARQLDDPHVVVDVRAALDASGLDPAALTVEVTETALIPDPGACAARLRDIKALGVRIAIDDFGSGYSSLAYLRDFPVDSLKLDRCFIQAIHSSPESDALVRAMVHLAQDLGLQTVAEGIESIEQLDELRHMRVNHAQGYLLARPMTVEAFYSNILGAARDELAR